MPDGLIARFIPGQPEESRLVTRIGNRTADQLARHIVDAHRRARSRRRLRDLTAEKYLIHIDGEGTAQWADIVDGTHVMVRPSLVDSLRLQRNLLRPLVDNMVAHHTSQEFRAVAESRPDKKARDKARIDTAFANQLIIHQRLNEVFAEALYMAAAYGHCPVHAQWRDDITSDLYEPVYNQRQDLDPELANTLMPGFVDVWCGDPWATTYNEGATRRSVQAITYDRVVPTQLLRIAFDEQLAALGTQLVGQRSLPSASRFQRTIRRWIAGFYGEGTAAIFGGQDGEELSAMVCRETAPGVDLEHPHGRLVIVVVNDRADVDERDRGGGGRLIPLYDGPLPGRRFSAVRCYAGARSDDVLGAPYVKDLDQLQVQLNHLVTMRAEFLTRFARAPLRAVTGSLADDTTVFDDDAIIEYDSIEGPPEFLYPPTATISFFDTAINETLEQMFRIGGWQAASRGEGQAGDPAAKVIALAKADDTVFAPVNRSLQASVCELLQTSHALARQYMTVPMLVDLVGEEYAHLAEPWIRREQMSDAPPQYRLVNSFGATPDSRGQQLLELVVRQGADGLPLLPTDQFWALYPDHSIRPPEIASRRVRQSRIQAINYAIESAVEDARQQFGELAEQYALVLHQQLGTEYPLLRSDRPEEHVEGLDELAQNLSVDPLARQLGAWRQDLYYDWMAAQAAAAAAAGQPQEAPGLQIEREVQKTTPTGPTGTSPQGGTPTAESLGTESVKERTLLTNVARQTGSYA